MSRWKASGIHLLLSCTIVGAVLAFMVTIWYRWPLFTIAGGAGITLILAGVDVTLGPLITLIVFKSGKKGLKFDLAFIAAVQVAALAYGIHVVYVARPVYLVFAVDRFYLVTAKDLDPEDLAKATDPRFSRPPLGWPSYIAAVLPREPQQQFKVLMSALQGKDVQLYPQYYVPYAEQAQSALKRAEDVRILLKRNPAAVRSFLESTGRSLESVKFLPLKARADAAVLIDTATGTPLCRRGRPVVRDELRARRCEGARAHACEHEGETDPDDAHGARRDEAPLECARGVLHHAKRVGESQGAKVGEHVGESGRHACDARPQHF
jgi:hypothetical protein